MFKIIASGILGFTVAMCAYGLAAPANAACDKEAAREALATVEEAFADRLDSPEELVVVYEWRRDWDKLSRSQKQRMTHGIGIMEHCLSGKEARIRYAGKDVGYYNAKGAVEIYD